MKTDAQAATAKKPSRAERQAALSKLWDKAKAHAMAGRVPAAIKGFSHLSRLAPNTQEVWLELAELRLKAQQFGHCIADLERALAVGPENGMILAMMARAKGILGRIDEGVLHCEAVVERHPDTAAVYFEYASLRKFDEETGPPVMAQIDRLLAKPDLEKRQRVFLHFAAGKIAQDLGDYDRALDGFTQGSAEHPERLDRPAFDELIDGSRNVFDGDQIARLRSLAKPRAEGAPRMVFIIGLPRSGSTLAEQMLVGGEGVATVGESGLVNVLLERYGKATKKPFPEAARDWGEEELNQFAVTYIKHAARIAGGRPPVIVDKSLFNYQRLGLLAAAFPDARFVHCRRDPLEAAWSCYSNLFEKGITFSYDYGDIAHTMARYQGLMAHWRDAGVEMFDLDYEAMIEKPAETVAALQAFTGLKEDLSVIDRRSGPRTIQTASKWQARQPIYTSARRRAREYGDRLDPLRAALREAGVEGAA